VEVPDDIDDLGAMVGAQGVTLSNRMDPGEVVEPGVGIHGCRHARPHPHFPGEDRIAYGGHEGVSHLRIVGDGVGLEEGVGVVTVSLVGYEPEIFDGCRHVRAGVHRPLVGVRTDDYRDAVLTTLLDNRVNLVGEDPAIYVGADEGAGHLIEFRQNLRCGHRAHGLERCRLVGVPEHLRKHQHPSSPKSIHCGS
jgi:hypothetical protein